MRLWHIRFDRQKLKRGSDESIVHSLPLRPLGRILELSLWESEGQPISRADR